MENDRIGQIMIELSILSQEQVDQVLATQSEQPAPFGHVAEKMFGIGERAIHLALADQVARRAPLATLCQETFDPKALQLLSAREAWDTLVLPIRWEDGVLLCATTVETLTSAIDLLQRKYDQPYRFTLAEMRPIEEFIASMYAYEGVDVVEDGEAA